MKLINPAGFGSMIRAYYDWTTPSTYTGVASPSLFASQAHAGCLVGDIIVVQLRLNFTQSVAANAGFANLADAIGQGGTAFATPGFADFGVSSGVLAVADRWDASIHAWGRVGTAGIRTINLNVNTKTTSQLLLTLQGSIQSWVLKGN